MYLSSTLSSRVSDLGFRIGGCRHPSSTHLSSVEGLGFWALQLGLPQ